MAMEGEVAEYFSVHEYGRTTKRKVYIFGSLLSGAFMFRPLIRELTDMGYACVLFLPKRKLIRHGQVFEGLVRAGSLLAEEVTHRIRVDKVIGVRDFSAIAVSSGSVWGMEAVRRCPDIRRIVLGSPFGDFRAHYVMWSKHRLYGRVLRWLTKDRRPSAEILSMCSPISRLSLMRGRKALICYSADDRIAHTAAIEALARQMNNDRIETDTRMLPGGHLRGLFSHMVTRKTYKLLISKRES